MKKAIKFLSIITTAAVVLSSCSSSENFAKRKYMPGIYMSKNHKKPTLDANKNELGVIKKSETKVVEEKVLNTSNALASKVSMVQFAQQSNLENVKTKSTKRIKQVVKSENTIEKNQVKKMKSSSRYISNDEEIITKKSPAQDIDGETVLLIILSFLVPPLAVYLKENTASQWFWITLLLCLVASGFLFIPFLGVAWLAAIVIAILIVFERL